MKKHLQLLLAAAALSCAMAFPALAAETKEEYKEERASIEAEIKELNSETKALKEEYKAVSQQYKAIQKEKKDSGTLSVDQEAWKEAKELKKEIQEISDTKNKTNVKDLRAEIKDAAKSEDFDTALDGLNQILEVKKTNLEKTEKIKQLWDEIDGLLN